MAAAVESFDNFPKKVFEIVTAPNETVLSLLDPKQNPVLTKILAIQTKVLKHLSDDDICLTMTDAQRTFLKVSRQEYLDIQLGNCEATAQKVSRLALIFLLVLESQVKEAGSLEPAIKSRIKLLEQIVKIEEKYEVKPDRSIAFKEDPDAVANLKESNLAEVFSRIAWDPEREVSENGISTLILDAQHKFRKLVIKVDRQLHALVEQKEIDKEGAFGDTYQMVHLETGMTHVYKQFKSFESKNFLQNTLREIENLKTLSFLPAPSQLFQKPPLLTIQAYSFPHQKLVVSGVVQLEFFKGDTLYNWIQRPQLTAKHRIDYSIQLLDLVSTWHSAGVFHCDIKSDNIIFEKICEGLPTGMRLIDYGSCLNLQTLSSEDECIVDLGCAGNRLEVTRPLLNIAFKDKNWKEVERFLRLRDLFATAIVCFNILMKVPIPYTQSGTKAYRWDWKDAMKKEYSNDLVEMFDNFFLQKDFYSFEHIVDKLKAVKK